MSYVNIIEDAAIDGALWAVEAVGEHAGIQVRNLTGEEPVMVSFSANNDAVHVSELFAIAGLYFASHPHALVVGCNHLYDDGPERLVVTFTE